MTEIEALLAKLSREPDFDAPELHAHDAADLLLLETAASLPASIGDRHGPRRLEQSTALRAVCPNPVPESVGPLPSGGLVVIGDRHGALTLGAAEMFGAAGIRVHQDALLSERALAANAARLCPRMGLVDYEQHALGESLLRGARLVLLRLPRSLAELEEIVWHIARWADAGVTVLAGGRDKHMSRRMNDVLSGGFGEVSAGLGQRKARVLTARSPRSAKELGDLRFPMRERDSELAFDLFAFGATFGGASFDRGSRLLLRTLGALELGAKPISGPRRDASAQVVSASGKGGAPERILDLGCGNGVLAVSAALAWPEAQVIATDQSAAAVAATRCTAEVAGVGDRVETHRADASEAVQAGWADLVLLNPPFHTGSTVHAGVAHRLIRSAAPALAHGGELRLVFNSHLGYRPLIEREIGPTRQLARDRTFTVLAATRR